MYPQKPIQTATKSTINKGNQTCRVSCFSRKSFLLCHFPQLLSWVVGEQWGKGCDIVRAMMLSYPWWPEVLSQIHQRPSSLGWIQCPWQCDDATFGCPRSDVTVELAMSLHHQKPPPDWMSLLRVAHLVPWRRIRQQPQNNSRNTIILSIDSGRGGPTHQKLMKTGQTLSLAFVKKGQHANIPVAVSV